MVELIKGNLLNADAEAIVNTVNCVGVMGRGIALQFRNAYPENYRKYKAACDAGTLQVGKVLTYDRNTLENPRYIINFPTKKHWKEKSRIEYITTGLVDLVKEIRRRKIGSIALPPLGCGLGGLNWEDVRPKIEAAFAEHPDIRVLLFEPVGPPLPGDMAHPQQRPKMTRGRAILLELMQRYLAGLMDTSVTLLELHKLMYFMQEMGEDLKLTYSKADHGPYAVNLTHVLKAIEGHYVIGYGDGQNNPDREIELYGDAGKEATGFLQHTPEILARLDKVTDLIEGFETPFGMELLATVYWVMQHEGASSEPEVVSYVHDWGKHKAVFSERQISIAYDVLKQKGLVPSARQVADKVEH